MRVTVDASVVIKWYVAEPRRAEARLLLEDGIDCHAPDFVLIECANVLWKKCRRKEIADPATLLEEIQRSEVVKLHPSASLLLDATKTAEEIDHPVYDCLYITCAQHTGSTLVTDDRRLTSVVKERLPSLPVLNLQDPEAAQTIAAAAIRLVIDPGRLDELLGAVRRLDATSKNIFEIWLRETGGSRDAEPEERALLEDSIPVQELLRLIGGLSDDERVDLLALGWLGMSNSETESWDRLLIRASESAGGFDARQIANFCHYWAKGRDRLAKLRTHPPA